MMERFVITQDRLDHEGYAFTSRRVKTGYECSLKRGNLYVQWLQGDADLGHDYYREYKRKLRETTQTEGRVL